MPKKKWSIGFGRAILVFVTVYAVVYTIIYLSTHGV